MYYFNLEVQFNTYPISTRVKEMLCRYKCDIGQLIGYQLFSSFISAFDSQPLHLGK